MGGRHGWTWLFLIEGLLTIVFGVAVYLFLPRRPATLRVLQPAERTWLQERHEHADRHARSKTSNGGKFWGEGSLRVDRSLTHCIASSEGSSGVRAPCKWTAAAHIA